MRLERGLNVYHRSSAGSLARATSASLGPFSVALSVLALAQLLGASVAAAGIAVSPLQQEVTVRPGREAELSLTVANVKRSPDAREQTVRVELVDFWVSPEGGISFGKEFEHSRSAVKWISLDADELVLKPGQSREIKGTVTAPFRADGDYWAAVMLTIGKPVERQGALNLVLRTACGVFVRVARRNYLEHLSIGGVDVRLPPLGAEDNPGPKESGEGAPGASEHEQALRVVADVTNEGLVKFNASGTATLYLEGHRRVAKIPLHTHRRRILPGHTRRFVGVMPSPLPAGNYSLRFVFDSGLERGRRAFKQADVEVDAELARRWMESGAGQNLPAFHVEPEELKQSLTAGRFTTMSVVVANTSLATTHVWCRLEPDTLPADWLEISPLDFTLGPAMRRSVVCRIAVPGDAQRGDYSGSLVIEGERAGLVGQHSVQPTNIPVQIALVR